MSSRSFEQEKNLSLTKDDYLRKAKNQKATAWVIFSGGIVTMTAGLITNLDKGFMTSNHDDKKKGAAAAVIGFVTTLSSIPFFVASHSNKEKANSISLGQINIPMLTSSGSMMKQVRCLSLKIALGRNKLSKNYLFINDSL